MSSRQAFGMATPAAPSGEQSVDTRQRLINAAIDLFLTVGYHDLRVSDITDYAGIGKATFYVHFSSKRDFLIAYFQEIFGHMEAVKAQTSDSDLDYFSKVAVRMRSSLDPDNRWNKVITFLRIAANSSDSEIAAASQGAHRRIARPAKESLLEAIRAGTVRKVDPVLTTLAFVGMTEVLAWRAEQDDSYDVETILAFLRDANRRFLTPTPADKQRDADPARTREKAVWAIETARATPSALSLSSDAGSTRQKLIDAAADLFPEAGYSHVRISDITKHAGVGKGTFYLHFADKRDLLLASFQHLLHGFEETEAEIVGADLEYLSKVALRMAQNLEPRWSRAMTFVRISANSPDPEIAAAARRVHAQTAEATNRDLAEAMRQGIVRELDPELVTYACIGMEEVLAWRLVQDDTYDSPAILAFLVDLFSRVFMNKEAAASW